MLSADEAFERTVYYKHRKVLDMIEVCISQETLHYNFSVYFDEHMDDFAGISKLLREKDFEIVAQFLQKKGYDVEIFFGTVTSKSKGDDARHCVMISW